MITSERVYDLNNLVVKLGKIKTDIKSLINDKFDGNQELIESINKIIDSYSPDTSVGCKIMKLQATFTNEVIDVSDINSYYYIMDEYRLFTSNTYKVYGVKSLVTGVDMKIGDKIKNRDNVEIIGFDIFPFSEIITHVKVEDGDLISIDEVVV